MANISSNSDVFHGPAVMYIGQDGETPRMVDGTVDRITITPQETTDNLVMPDGACLAVRYVSGITMSGDVNVWRGWGTSSDADGDLHIGNTTTSHHENTVRLCKQGIISVDIAEQILGYLPDELKDMVHEIEQQDKPIRVIRTD